LVRSLNEADEIQLIVTPIQYTNAGDREGTPCYSQPASTTKFTAALKAMDVTLILTTIGLGTCKLSTFARLSSDNLTIRCDLTMRYYRSDIEG